MAGCPQYLTWQMLLKNKLTEQNSFHEQPQDANNRTCYKLILQDVITICHNNEGGGSWPQTTKHCFWWYMLTMELLSHERTTLINVKCPCRWLQCPLVQWPTSKGWLNWDSYTRTNPLKEFRGALGNSTWTGEALVTQLRKKRKKHRYMMF